VVGFKAHCISADAYVLPLAPICTPVSASAGEPTANAAASAIHLEEINPQRFMSAFLLEVVIDALDCPQRAGPGKQNASQ
jgi:hypothetical protein